MSTDSSGATFDSGRWRAPVQCPGSTTSSAPQPPPAFPVADKPRLSEAGILAQAYIDGNLALERSHLEVRPPCDEMIHTYRQAEADVEEYNKFASEKVALHAQRNFQKVAERHANDGPEDRRHQPKWLSPWLIWPVFLASAAYDTVFIGDILQQLIDAAPNSFPFYAAYFPGLGIMVGLLLSAHLLGVAHVRRRDRLERRRIRQLIWGKREREDDHLPWPMWTLALAFSTFVVGTLGAWALIRAKLGSIPTVQWDLSVYHVYSALLLLLLSIAAVVMRVVAHNPYAISSKAADERMAKGRTESESLRRKAVTGITRHAQAWAALQAALAVALSHAQRLVDAGRARILELRAEKAESGQPMHQNASLTTLEIWRVDSEGGITAGPEMVDLLGELRLRTEVLDYAKDMADRHRPEKLEAMLDGVDTEMRRQFGGTEEKDMKGDSDN